MRLTSALLLCLLLPTAVLPQGKPILEQRSDLEFADAPDERVVAHQFVDGENKLVLVGRKVIRVLDFASAKFTESRLLEVPEFGEDKPRVISPDGRRMIVFGNYDSRRKEDKVKRPASVWDLETGKQIAALDKTSKPVRAALWSNNGKTLATSSDRYAPRFADSSSVEVAFWDGETIAYQNSLPTDKAGWWNLTADGGKCIYTTGEVKGINIPLLENKYISPAGTVSVWDIGSAKQEETLSTRAGNIERRVIAIDISPDGKFLALALQPPQSKETERSLTVWEIKEGGTPIFETGPRYELKPGQKFSGYVMFSPGGKYFALDVGKSLQIYETRTGEKRFELLNLTNASHWLTDDIVYNDRSTRLEAYEVATGKPLYQLPMVYHSFSYTPVTSFDPNDTTYNFPVTEVMDETKVITHPNGMMFLTYSNQYVKVFDTRTGELLQTLVSPPMDYTKKKPKLSSKALVDKAGWSADGKSLYIISADRKRVSLWRLL